MGDLTLFEVVAMGSGCIDAVVASDVGMSVGGGGASSRRSAVRNGGGSACLSCGRSS